jgi:hypothetical protein
MANHFCNDINRQIKADSAKILKVTEPITFPSVQERIKVDPRSKILDEQPKEPQKIKIQILRRYGVKLIESMQKLFAFMLKGKDFEISTTEVLSNIIDCTTFKKYEFEGTNHNASNFYNSFWMTFDAGFEVNKNVS